MFADDGNGLILLYLLVGAGFIGALYIGLTSDEEENSDDGPLPINGTDFDDTISGSFVSDIIHGAGGDDSIYGNLGDDTIYGGEYLSTTDENGEAILLTNNDIVYGAQGNDILYGNSQNDMIAGGSGDDTLYGGTGSDILETLDIFNDAEELYIQTHGNDTVYGGAGADTLNAGLGHDKLNGEEGNDTIDGRDTLERSYEFGARTGDRLIGGDGDDTLYGDDGDTMWGGIGRDVFELDTTTNGVSIVDETTIIIKDFEATEDELVLHDESVFLDDQALADEYDSGGEALFETTEDEEGIYVLLGPKKIALLEGVTIAEMQNVSIRVVYPF